MKKRILILTQTGDTHAYAVSEALTRKGAEPTLWHTCDFPSHSLETFLLDEGGSRVVVNGLELDIHDFRFDTVWHRRPTLVVPGKVLHPADRQFAETECRIFQKGLFEIMAPDAFWVNPIGAAARASRKIFQLDSAQKIGLRTPTTLCTNDPSAIRSFIRQHGGTVIWKAFGAVPWQDEDTFWVPFTSTLTEEQLVDDKLLKTVPGIYQVVLDKAFEVRVTVVGGHVLAAKIFSQETDGGRLDWRKAYGELKMEPFELRNDIAALCAALLDRLGLVFGCFDFIVTPAGDYVFLEVNEMGQFLFVEHYSGLPLLDAFSEFLMQGRIDFAWNPESPRLRYSDVAQCVKEIAEHCGAIHTPVPESAAWEGEPRAN